MVEFNVSGSGVLTVDSDTLYVDNGIQVDEMYDQTMGVYLDMGLGLSSALIPSENTVTTPEAGEIILPGNGPQPSDISIENIVFDGDNVSFDIYVNEIPSTITGWSSIVFRGNLNDEFITSPGLDSGAEFVTLSDEFSDIYASPQIWLYDDYLSIKPSSGFNPVNFTGKVASFSGPAGLFGSMADDGTNTTTWNPQDLLYNSDSGLENNFGFFSDSVQFYQDAFVYPYMDDLLTLNALEDDGSTRLALDGTVGDVNAMPWMIELTDYDDVFIGRDAVYDSATNSYDPGNEYHSNHGSDMIDGGGGLNTADFFLFTSMGFNLNGIDFNMNDWTGVDIDEGAYHHPWHGFQIVHGTAGWGYHLWNRDNDHSVPEEFMHMQLGDNHIHSGAGTNIIIGGDGSNTIYGNGGRDYLDLNSG